MTTRERHGAKGQMYLQRDCEESSSGHVEHFDDIELEASPDEKLVILKKSKGEKNFIRDKDGSYSESQIEISVADLVRLIEKNGRRI